MNPAGPVDDFEKEKLSLVRPSTFSRRAGFFSTGRTRTLVERRSDMSIRPVKQLARSEPTIEGAGVHLHRAFGFGDTTDFDPFLLLDDFRNDRPDEYMAGFPWHPHRSE